MMSLRNLLVAAVCGAMALALVSCGDYVGKEKSHPLFVKGGTCKASQNYKDAAKYFEEFLLTVCPKSAKTHYELATIYGDSLDDQVKAIYHYQAYIELSPQGVSDEASVKQFIELNRKKLFEKLMEENKATPEAEKIAKELADAKVKLLQYVDYAKKLKEQNEIMKQRLFGGKAKRVAPAPADKTAPADKKAPKFETYKTKAGDTFESISKAVYGSTTHAKLIRSANKNAGAKLKPGTELKVPPLPPVANGKPVAPAPAPAPVPTAGDQPQQDMAEQMGVGVKD